MSFLDWADFLGAVFPKHHLYHITLIKKIKQQTGSSEIYCSLWNTPCTWLKLDPLSQNPSGSLWNSTAELTGWMMAQIFKNQDDSNRGSKKYSSPGIISLAENGLLLALPNFILCSFVCMGGITFQKNSILWVIITSNSQRCRLI